MVSFYVNSKTPAFILNFSVLGILLAFIFPVIDRQYRQGISHPGGSSGIVDRELLRQDLYAVVGPINFILSLLSLLLIVISAYIARSNVVVNKYIISGILLSLPSLYAIIIYPTRDKATELYHLNVEVKLFIGFYTYLVGDFLALLSIIVKYRSITPIDQKLYPTS